MRLTKNWKHEIKELFNIDYVENYKSILGSGVIFATRCSKTKGSGNDCKIPKEFYLSSLNLRFYDYCENNGITYGIISDLYGIHFQDEIINSYDSHPKSLTIENKKELGNIIATKCRERKYTTIIFFSQGPDMNRPYFEMLSYSGLKVYYVTKLIKGIKYKKSIPICINL